MDDFTPAENIQIPDSYFNRIKTGVETLDFLFNDGLLPGSTITLDGQRGTGKTRFCLQLLDILKNKGYLVGYMSNEESKEQLAFTCKSINVNKVPIAAIKTFDDIVRAIYWHDVLIVDSFSMIDFEEFDCSARAAEKRCIKKIIDAAHESGCCVIIILHHTKSGQMKGSSLIAHKVDANLHLKQSESDDKMRDAFFSKNRFGPNNSISVVMNSNGYDFTQVEKNTISIDDIFDTPKKSKMKNQCIEILELPEINIKRVMEYFNFDNLKATRYLKELCLQGLLFKVGRGETAQYIKAETNDD